MPYLIVGLVSLISGITIGFNSSDFFAMAKWLVLLIVLVFAYKLVLR